MFKYVVKRILLMLLTFFIIMTLCFILVKMLPLTNLPQDPALRDIILARRELMGYNKPILVQYGIFLQRVILHWDWGIGSKFRIVFR